MLALAFVFHVFESNRVSNSAGSGTVWHMRTHAGDGSPCTAADRTGAWMVAPKTGLVMKADGNERKIALFHIFKRKREREPDSRERKR
jgi:hypothetical protein